MKLNRVVGGGQQVEIDLKEQWLRKQSGLEAARIYNLGERCICLLAVYHPKDEKEKLLLRSKEREGFREMKPPPALAQSSAGNGRTNGTSGASTSSSSSSIGERLLSPFIKWHAPPVPKVPSAIHLQEVNGDGCESEEEKRIRIKQLQNKLQDEDGALIIGTLNIHFGQPFRPKPKVNPNHNSLVRGGGSGNGNAKLDHLEQVRGNGNGSNSNRGILRSVENAGGQNHLSVSTKARVLNSLWRMKQQQEQQQQQPLQQTKELDFFQLPSEEKALQKLNRGIKQAYIFNLCVSPVFRRQGIATMLLDRAQEIATKKGVKECFLHVDFGNDAAEKLYRENGYALEDDEEGKWRYIAGTRKRQLMRKRIP
jgi:ribosomal protein S18 acetylase RimI-like enzyme